jgi:hypothetical protein
MTSIIKVDTIQDQDGNNIINENADTITIGASGDTISIPAGATLANNGTATGFGSIAWQSSIVTAATLSAVSGNGYWIDTTSNACTVTLPASAAVGDTIVFVDYARNWGTNAVTINTNSLNFQGGTISPSYATDGLTISITYSGATQGWIPTDDDTSDNTQIYDIDFLVVAGGGGGGGQVGGGGGGGGFRTSTQSVTTGIAITVTVGDGGTGGSHAPSVVVGTQGSDSSISGSGLTTITSAGGGRGGVANQYNGGNGGSGGGGSGASNSTAGSGNTPSTSPSQGNNGGTGQASATYAGAGGGGAGAVGVNASSGTAGAGGTGTASSITGSSVTYAGGGGGALDSTASGASGGAGGGGNGGTSTGGNGTANTGGGAGAGGTPGVGGVGGKGVVILSIPTANYSGTVTGSPTEATSGANTILSFTGDGSYTT